jgi:hypothetical protein
MGDLLVGITPQVILVVKMTDHKPLRLDIRVARSNTHPLKKTNKRSESHTSHVKKEKHLLRQNPSIRDTETDHSWSHPNPRSPG